MEELQVNIQETSFLLGVPPEKGSEMFKSALFNLGIPYKPGMRVSLKDLKKSGKENMQGLIEKAVDINTNYFKRYEGKLRLLSDHKCIETGLWGSSKNAPVKVFLKQEDIEKIESNWKIKRDQFYSQQTLFDVENKLYVPKKSSRKKSEKKISAPN